MGRQGACTVLEEGLAERLLPTGVHAMCEHRRSNTSTIYIGGTFNIAGPYAVNNFARWDVKSGEWLQPTAGVGPVLSINFARGSGDKGHFLGSVLTLACPDDSDYIYLGGYFNVVGGRANHTGPIQASELTEA